MEISIWKFQNEILNLLEKESDEHIEGDIKQLAEVVSDKRYSVESE